MAQRDLDASCPLMEMRQGDRAVVDFVIKFRTRFWEINCVSDAVAIKDEPVSHDLPTSQDGYQNQPSNTD